jgi:hypothetical protein
MTLKPNTFKMTSYGFEQTSIIPDTACKAGEGNCNIDGRCILGGRVLSSGLRGNSVASLSDSNLGCVAYPVYLKTDVPYSIGYVVGSNFGSLEPIIKT